MLRQLWHVGQCFAECTPLRTTHLSPVSTAYLERFCAPQSQLYGADLSHHMHVPHVLRHFFVLTFSLRHRPFCNFLAHQKAGFVSKQVFEVWPLHDAMSLGQLGPG